jgi:hypothetical protein
MKEELKEAFNYLYYYYGVSDAPDSRLSKKEKEAWMNLGFMIKKITASNTQKEENTYETCPQCKKPMRLIYQCVNCE